MHSLFKLSPTTAAVSYLQPHELNYHLLQAANVIITDEFSQLLGTHLNSMLTQLSVCKGAHHESLLLDNITMAFIGDPKQLPPICRHTEQVCNL